MSTGYTPERLRRRLVSFGVEGFHRVIRNEHDEDPLGVVVSPSRFSDPVGRFSVLYAAEVVRCSFWESIVRSRFTHRKRGEIPQSIVAGARIVTLHSTKTLRLVDLRGDGPIRIGAPTAVAHDANHTAGRALSAAIYDSVAEADGIVFNSRFTSASLFLTVQ